MRLKLSATLALLAFLASGVLPVRAQVELNPSHPDTYTVRGGDTLWDIAGRFLRDPWRWPEIWDANRELGDPNLIYPGDVLRLYYRDGQPRVGRAGGMRTVKLSPRVRVTPLKVPVPTIPLGTIGPFLTVPYVLSKEQIDAAPYVVSFPDSRVLAGTGDTVYVRSILSAAGGRYHLVRPGDPLRSPESNNILGYKAIYVATGALERPGDPATLRIIDMALETIAGDRVLVVEGEKPLQTFLPRPAPRGRSGHIISVLNGVAQIGQFDVVVLDLGSDQGLQPGHVFTVYSGGDRVTDSVRADTDSWNWKSMKFWSQEFWYGDYRAEGFLNDSPDPNAPFPPHADVRKQSEDYILPYEDAGTLMVFRTFQKLSFALVLRARRVMHVLDMVRPPPA
jgi:hypothetical protein